MSTRQTLFFIGGSAITVPPNGSHRVERRGYMITAIASEGIPHVKVLYTRQ